MSDAPQDDRPDVATALHAAARLLHDVRERLGDDDDLGLRAGALRAALLRLHRHLTGEPS